MLASKVSQLTKELAQKCKELDLQELNLIPNTIKVEVGVQTYREERDIVDIKEFKRLQEFERNMKFVDKVYKGRQSFIDVIDEDAEENETISNQQ